MTVTDLIEHLKTFNPDEPIYLVNGVGAGDLLHKGNVYRERSVKVDRSTTVLNVLVIDAGW